MLYPFLSRHGSEMPSALLDELLQYNLYVLKVTSKTPGKWFRRDQERTRIYLIRSKDTISARQYAINFVFYMELNPGEKIVAFAVHGVMHWGNTLEQLF